MTREFFKEHAKVIAIIAATLIIVPGGLAVFWTMRSEEPIKFKKRAAPPENPSPTTKTKSPILKEAQESEKKLMQEKGSFYRSFEPPDIMPKDEDKPPAPKPKPKQHYQPAPLYNPKKRIDRSILWAKYISWSPGVGEAAGIKEKKVSNASKTQNVSPANGPGHLNIELWCPIEAEVIAPAVTFSNDTGSKILRARTAKASCGVPEGSIFIGKPRLDPETLRADVNFNIIKLPDGKIIKTIAHAYDMNEFPGIGSYVERNDIKYSILQALSKGLSAGLEAAKSDTKTTVYFSDKVIIEENKAKDRLKEGLKAGGSEGFKSLGSDFLKKQAENSAPLVWIEKGLPIKIMIEETP